jgi:hypothetical protein
MLVASYLLLASCAQLASYLCLLIYVTLSISAQLLASPFAPKGQTSISNEGFALQLRPDRRFCFYLCLLIFISKH